MNTTSLHSSAADAHAVLLACPTCGSPLFLAYNDSEMRSESVTLHSIESKVVATIADEYSDYGERFDEAHFFCCQRPDCGACFGESQDEPWAQSLSALIPSVGAEAESLRGKWMLPRLFDYPAGWSREHKSTPWAEFILRLQLHANTLKIGSGGA